MSSSCGCWESDGSCGCWTNRSGTSSSSAQLKLYRTFIFCVPVFFALILLFLFYLFYLRPRHRGGVGPPLHSITPHHHPTSSIRFGLNKELREMLPILVYNQSFSVRDTQCSVCLVDYLPEDRLQQIPACGHTFHMSCIDLWLTTHTTCPLCRFCLLTSAKSSTQTYDMQSQNNEETQGMEFSESRSANHQEAAVLQNVSAEVSISSECIDVEGQNVQNNQ